MARGDIITRVHAAFGAAPSPLSVAECARATGLEVRQVHTACSHLEGIGRIRRTTPAVHGRAAQLHPLRFVTVAGVEARKPSPPPVRQAAGAPPMEWLEWICGAHVAGAA